MVATQIAMDAALQTAEPAPVTTARTDSEPSTLGLTEIYAAYFKGVWRNLRRLGVPDALLDDAVQDVFLVVHRRHAEFERRSLLKTWIFGIVLHVAKDYRRAARRHAARVAGYAQEVTEASNGQGPAETAELREASRLLHAILERMRYEERVVFVLVELEEMTVRDAAAACAVSLATCQRRLHRARASFDAALNRLNAQPHGRQSP